MIIFIFIILPPILLLLIFPTCLFNKLSRHLKPRWAVSIQIFVDTIQGCYKDGTDGTRDYRAVSRYLLAVCLLIPAFQVVTILQPKDLLKCLAYTALLIALTVLYAVVRPYKHTSANISGVALLANMALFLLSLQLVLKSALFGLMVMAVILVLPHCVFYSYLVYQLGKLVKQHCRYIWQERLFERQLCSLSNTHLYTQIT